jgi:hypothetical protein
MHDLRQRSLSDRHADALQKTSGYRVAHSSRCCGALLIGIAPIALLFAYEII